MAPRWSLKRAKQIWTSVGWTGLWSMNLWGTRHGNRALAARLADFLQFIQKTSTLSYQEKDLTSKKKATKTFKPKGQPWERQARSQCALTHRIREDGKRFSSEEGRETTSDTTPLASVAGSVRMQPTDSDRSVRVTPKKTCEASPPSQDDLWVMVKNLSQQVAAQQAELTTFVDALVLQQKAMTIQQKATANTEKILSNLVDHMTSINEATQATVAAILARLEAGPAVPQIVVADNKDYSP
ncbi:hypothetical protein BASA62_003243 [Batrachochytrium salamandrivorans]|nr:hypothetical protein BASA62_003243 [Batrachochytrium salamandrivorans]